MARITLEHVDKRYPNGFVASRDLSLEIADGETVKHQLVPRLKINDVADVRGDSALGLSRVAKTGAGRADGLAFRG